jgi:hypothetical protein
VACILAGFGLPLLIGQAKEPAAIFTPALEEIRGKTRIPILLPPKLPPPFVESAIKHVFGDASPNRYRITMYVGDEPSGATYAGTFGGAAEVLPDLPNTRRVTLTSGLIGIFRPVMCGGSCAPANLWWLQNGVTYHLAIQLASNMKEKDQEKIMVEAANTTIRQE